MRQSQRFLALAVLLAAIAIASEARAGSRPDPSSPAGTYMQPRANRSVSIETVVEYGNNVQPVTIVENSSVNIARVIEFGGTGAVDATVVQNGTRNYVDVMQVGASTSVAIGQSGANNVADITQVGNSTNALLLQIGDMNTGTVRQFGRFNWLSVFQFSR